MICNISHLFTEQVASKAAFTDMPGTVPAIHMHTSCQICTSTTQPNISAMTYASPNNAAHTSNERHLTFKKYRFVTPSKRGSEFELDGNS